MGAAFSQRACGYALANKGHNTRTLQAYLGHRNIQYTVRYTEVSPTHYFGTGGSGYSHMSMMADHHAGHHHVVMITVLHRGKTAFSAHEVAQSRLTIQASVVAMLWHSSQAHHRIAAAMAVYVKDSQGGSPVRASM